MRLKRQVHRCERELAAHKNAASAQAGALQAAIGDRLRSMDALAVSFGTGLALGLLRPGKTSAKSTKAELPAYVNTLLKLAIPTLISEVLRTRKSRDDSSGRT